MMTFISGFILGVFSLLGYMVWRMLRSDGWDDSNITNALRVLSHVVLHPEDFGRMFYLREVQQSERGATPVQFGGLNIMYLRRPFWYINKDEITEVVKTRSPNAN